MTAIQTKTQPKQEVARKLRPLVDVFESETAYLLELDVPGAIREQISVSVEQDTLKVSARRGETLGQEGASSDPVTYERDFALPPGTDRDNVKATYNAGVLGIQIPKQESAKPRKVPVVAH